MILALEYDNLKREATESLASLYNSFLKRVDYTAEKEKKGWAIEWKKYREGEEMELNTIIEGMPEWMQYTFQHFNNIHGFTREIERAFMMHDEELKQAYKIGKADAKKKPYSETLHEYRMPFKNHREQLETQAYKHIRDIFPTLLQELQPNQI